MSSRLTDDVSPPSERRFGITIGIALAVIGLILPLLGGHFRTWILVAAALFLIAAVAAPPLLKVPNLIWFRFGLLLHRIINPLVLGALFLVVVIPIALVMRLAGQKLLNRAYDPAAKSYWIERTPPGPPVDSIRNQY